MDIYNMIKADVEAGKSASAISQDFRDFFYLEDGDLSHLSTFSNIVWDNAVSQGAKIDLDNLWQVRRAYRIMSVTSCHSYMDYLKTSPVYDKI